MPLFPYYKRAVLRPATWVIAGYLVFAVIYVLFDLQQDYRSEWLAGNEAMLYTIPLVMMNAMFVALLSLPVFLNTYPPVQRRPLLQFLSWFLLPGTWIGYLLGKHLYYLLRAGNRPDGETLFIMSNTLPFVLGLILSFRAYRRDGQHK